MINIGERDRMKKETLLIIEKKKSISDPSIVYNFLKCFKKDILSETQLGLANKF